MVQLPTGKSLFLYLDEITSDHRCLNKCLDINLTPQNSACIQIAHLLLQHSPLYPIIYLRVLLTKYKKKLTGERIQQQRNHILECATRSNNVDVKNCMALERCLQEIAWVGVGRVFGVNYDVRLEEGGNNGHKRDV